VSAPEVRVEIWGKDFERLAFVTPVAVDATTRRYARSSATVSVDPTDTETAAAALEPGARAVVLYDTPGGATRQLVAGPILPNPKGPALSGVSFGVDGDWLDVLAWPTPAAAITAQGKYHRVSGAAETVIKTYVNAAVARLSLPLTVPATAALGSTLKWALRYANLGDQVATIAAAGGVDVDLTQIVGGLRLDVFEGVDRTQIALSESGGTITDWSMQVTPPSVTRAVAGGAGDGDERQMRAYANTAAEADWGVVREVFLDASDVEVDDFTELTARATRAVADGVATYSLTANLAEADFLRVGDTCWLGDLVLLRPIPGISQAQNISEIRVTGSAGQGWVAVPTAGDPDAEPSRLTVRAIHRLASAIRTLRAR
jgi:hypothetical protein